MGELITILSILFFVWVVFEILEGAFQGYYYDLLPYDKGHPNIHFAYGIMRGIVLVALSWITYYDLGFWLSVVFGTSLFFAAPFFHNGMMYTIRNVCNPKIYRLRWWADKEKTENPVGSAKIEIECGFRLLMLGISLLFLPG